MCQLNYVHYSAIVQHGESSDQWARKAQNVWSSYLPSIFINPTSISVVIFPNFCSVNVHMLKYFLWACVCVSACVSKLEKIHHVWHDALFFHGNILRECAQNEMGILDVPEYTSWNLPPSFLVGKQIPYSYSVKPLFIKEEKCENWNFRNIFLLWNNLENIQLLLIWYWCCWCFKVRFNLTGLSKICFQYLTHTWGLCCHTKIILRHWLEAISRTHQETLITKANIKTSVPTGHKEQV